MKWGMVRCGKVGYHAYKDWCGEVWSCMVVSGLSLVRCGMAG